MLREECTPSSSWWEDVQHHANSINSTSFYHKNSNNNSNTNVSCEEDNLSISTVNASRRLELTGESSNHHSLSAQNQPASSSDELLRDHVVSSQNHLWSLAFLPNRSLGDQMMDQHHHQHHITSSRNSSTTSELPFAPPCDNTNNGWIYDTNQVRYDQSSEQRLSKLSDLVGKHWSIAPPNNPDMNQNLHHHFNHDHSQTTSNISMHRQAMEVKNEENLCYNNSLSGGGSLFHDPMESSRSFLDIRLSRPLADINPSFKPCFKAFNLSEFNKKEHQTTSLATVTLETTNTGKKRRCEDISDEVSKKSKGGGSNTLSPEKELPKAKLRDKITTLQQIVSPFGKTDTASVLQEAITYINFYQEQVKLLSTPYMKNSSIKDPWGGWEKEEHNKRGTKHLDLKSRGLCLVPISLTPIAYRDNSAADYWSPSYRGSLYR